jgi:hypothetical protein
LETKKLDPFKGFKIKQNGVLSETIKQELTATSLKNTRKLVFFSPYPLGQRTVNSTPKLDKIKLARVW